MAARGNSPTGDDRGDDFPPPNAFDELLTDAARGHVGGGGGEATDPRGDTSSPPGPDLPDAHAPVPLGGQDPDRSYADDPLHGEAHSAPSREPVAEDSTAKLQSKDPWRRPARERALSGRGQSRTSALRDFSVPARLGRLIAAGVAVVATAGVVLVVAPSDGERTGTTRGPGTDPLALERQRAARLEVALRRESSQRYAWEMWAREFNRDRYRTVKRRAARQAARGAKPTKRGS